MAAEDVVYDGVNEADPGEPAWEWRREYLHEIED
jgi:hypothetical protein